MLKHFYENETDIPENLKGAYEAKDGKWYLKKLDDTHPVVAKNRELLSTNASQKTSIEDLTREKAQLEAKVIPAGQKAVPKEIAELGEAAQKAGLAKDEIATVKTELEEFKQKDEQRSQTDLFTAAANGTGLKPETFVPLAQSSNLKIEKSTEKIDGKDVEVFYVAENVNGTDTKTKLKEYVEKSERFAPFLEALVQKDAKGKGFTFAEQGGKPVVENDFDQIRKSVKEQYEPKHKGNVSFVDQFYGTQLPAAKQD